MAGPEESIARIASLMEKDAIFSCVYGRRKYDLPHAT